MVKSLDEPKHNKSSKNRNSSLELVRLLAMFGIVSYHFLVHSNFNIIKQPMSFNKVFIESFFSANGKVGVVLFLSITIWFLVQRDLTLSDSLRRVWLMERELLFYSILIVICLLYFKHHIGIRLIYKTLFPLLTGIWWYPTSYAILIVLMPFLNGGLRALGRKKHLILAVTSFCMWTVIPTVMPNATLSMSPQSVMALGYLYILITYVRWYAKPLSLRNACFLIIVGYTIFLTYSVVFSFIEDKYHRFGGRQISLSQSENMLPVIMIAWG